MWSLIRASFELAQQLQSSLFEPNVHLSEPRDDDRITSTLSALGDAKQQQGKFPEAEKLYRQTLALTRSRHGNDAVEVAAA